MSDTVRPMTFLPKTRNACVRADDGILVSPLSRHLYQMMVRQLHFDGYVAAASAVADAAGVIVPSIETDGDRLLRLTARGLACEAVDAHDVHVAALSGVVERYINASKLYMPLVCANDMLIGTSAHTVHERVCTAALGGTIRDVAFSSDGELVACAGTNGLAIILAMQVMHDVTVQGETRSPHEGYTKSTAVPASGREGAASDAYGAATRRRAYAPNDITELATARRLREHARSVEFIRFHPFQTIVASGGHDQTLYLHDYAQPTSRVLLTIRDESVLRNAAFHPAGDYMLYATDSPHVRLVNIETGRVLTTAGGVAQRDIGNAMAGQTDGHRMATAALTSVAYAQDGRSFVTSSLDGTWMLHDGASGKVVHCTTNAHSSVPVTSVQYSNSGNYILTAGMDSMARLWDIRRLTSVETSMTDNIQARVSYTVNQGRSVSEVAAYGKPIKSEHRCLRAMFTMNEGHIVMQSHDLTSIDYYSVQQGDVTCTTTTTPTVQQRGMTVSRTAQLCASGGEDNRLHIWANACNV